MEKVKISKLRADALDEMFKQGIDNRSNIIKAHFLDSNAWTEHCTPLNGMGADELIRAVYYGYEVEETPEDKVWELYIEQKQSLSEDQLRSEVAIKSVLNLLNIKIEGIN